MKILVPVDGSDCSMRALRYAIDLARSEDGTLHIVHFTDYETESTTQLERRVEETIESSGIDSSMEIIGDIRMSDLKSSDRVGRHILDLVEEGDFAQIVMGHHGTGFVEKALLGSAAKTVVEKTDVPVTIVP